MYPTVLDFPFLLVWSRVCLAARSKYTTKNGVGKRTGAVSGKNA